MMNWQHPYSDPGLSSPDAPDDIEREDVEMIHDHYDGTTADICEECGQEIYPCRCPCSCGCSILLTEDLCNDCKVGNHELPPRSNVEFELPLLKEIVAKYEDALVKNVWEEE
jgi:hypothetical protein